MLADGISCRGFAIIGSIYEPRWVIALLAKQNVGSFIGLESSSVNSMKNADFRPLSAH